MVFSKTDTRRAVFKRGQLVWAAWSCLTGTDGSTVRAADIPKKFHSRMVKMNELGVPIRAENKPGQPGVDIEYSAADAFVLMVALMLQDAGMKQAEVAFLVHAMEDDLRRWFDLILESPPAPRMRLLGEDRPASPRRAVLNDDNRENTDGLGDKTRSRFADTAVFLSFRYIEISEAWPERKLGSTPWAGKSDPPFILRPKFHRGLRALMAEMNDMATAFNDPTRMVLELSNVAVRLNAALQKAPLSVRGRAS